MKLDNVLLESPESCPRIVLCDFGIAKKLRRTNERTETVVGTIEYSAPEIFADTYSVSEKVAFGNGYDYKCDLWSLGVMTHIMLSGISPFMRTDEGSETIKRARHGRLFFDIPQWEEVTEIGKNFTSSLLQVDPVERYDVELCFAHPWIKKRSSLLEDLYKKKIWGR